MINSSYCIDFVVLQEMKPFLTNKGCLDNSDIMLRGDNEMITDDKRLAKLFNEHYINIIEWSSGLKLEKTVCHDEDFDKKMVLHNIIGKYENHSNITKIKNYMPVKSHQRQKGVWYGQNTNKTGKVSIKLSIKAIGNSYQQQSYFI